MASRTHNIPNKREQGAGKAFPLGGRRHGRAVTDEGCTMRQQTTGNGGMGTQRRTSGAPPGGTVVKAQKDGSSVPYILSSFPGTVKAKDENNKNLNRRFQYRFRPVLTRFFRRYAHYVAPHPPVFSCIFHKKQLPGPAEGSGRRRVQRLCIHCIFTENRRGDSILCPTKNYPLYIVFFCCSSSAGRVARPASTMHCRERRMPSLAWYQVRPPWK